MSSVQDGRYTFDHDGDVVVFVIGMRINKLRKVRKWFPTMLAMPKMLKQLGQHPEKGLLGYQQCLSGRTIMVLQYWQSFEHLQQFARNTDDPHLSAWRAFNRRVGTRGDVGIFHETYRVQKGNAEAVYNNMPVFGLAKATACVPVERRGQSAAYRTGTATEDDVLVEA